MRKSFTISAMGKVFSLQSLAVPAIISIALLSGCGAGKLTQPGLATQGAGAVGAQSPLPPEITAKKELIAVNVLNTLSRTNPFKSLIEPEKKVVEKPEDIKDTGPPPPPPLPPNPLESFEVSGILYRDKKSLAIMSLPGGKSKIVHQGDILKTMSQDTVMQVKITSIGQASLTMQLLHPPPTFPPDYIAKTVLLPSLMGYQSKSSKKAAGPAKSAGKPDTPEGSPLEGAPLQGEQPTQGMAQSDLSKQNAGNSGQEGPGLGEDNAPLIKQLESELKDLAQ